ncbi:MAG: hypothetical protein AB1468_00130 [Candidatus Micrarchaeota archaeon]
MADSEEITYEYLRRAQARERGSPVLSELPDEFYASVQAAVERWDRRTRERFSLSEAKEYENILKIIRDIYARREQKIVLAALRSARGEERPSGLAPAEQEFFESVARVVGENNRRFESLILRRASELREDAQAFESAGKERQGAKDRKRIRLLSDLPTFIGFDMSTYGPFKSGEMHSLPKRDAELLISKKFAEEA